MDIKIEPDDKTQQTYSDNHDEGLQMKKEDLSDDDYRKATENLPKSLTAIKQEEEEENDHLFSPPNCEDNASYGTNQIKNPEQDNQSYYAEWVPEQIPAVQSSSSSRHQLPISPPVSLDDVHFEEFDEKILFKEIVVVVNLEKKTFNGRHFVCSVCMNLFASLRSLQVHRNDHKTYRLSASNNMIDSRGERRERSRISQSSLKITKRYQCIQCNYNSTRKRSLKIHNSTKHSGMKPFECIHCDYKSVWRSAMATHKLLHSGPQPFKCGQCDYKSIRRGNIKRHKLLHTGQKPFKCNRCDYAASHKLSLKIHNMSHNGKKPFKCSDCDFKTAYKTSLTTHKFLHNEKKPFNCNQCDYECIEKSSLKLHQIKHSDKKPFQCNQCDYACSRNRWLKIHQMSHSGEKPFKCNQCRYESSRKSSLKRHQMTQHKMLIVE